MLLTLLRLAVPNATDPTFGTLQDDENNRICDTLELPWRDNAHDISCVPPAPDVREASYPIVRFHSPHLGYTLFQLRNVPGRSGVDIHIGNTVADIKGCIALGTSFAVFAQGKGVSHSRLAFQSFMDRMEGIDSATLRIVNPI